MIAAIQPLLYAERGAQMTFVLQVLSHLSPATYVLHGVRARLIDDTPLSALFADVWPLVVMGAVLIPFGLWAFGRAERYAKRTGKLKRVG